MRTVKGQAGSPLLEAIKEHGTWFTISVVGLVVIFGITLVNDPSKWWVGLAVAAGLSLFLFTAANGRVVLKAIGSLFVLGLSIAGAGAMGSLVTTVPLFGLTWPVYQLSVYLLALALSYVAYSGRGRWTYLGLMAIGQFGITALLVVINTDPHISTILGAFVAFGGFAAAYFLNGRTRVSKLMPASGFSRDFLEALIRGAEKLNLELRIVPARRGIDSHVLVYGDRAVILYPIALDQAFGAIGRRMSRLGYRGKDINPWLLRLSFFTSPSWKSRGASPSLVLVDVNKKNGGEGKVIGISLPDSKRKAVVGVQPAPPSRKDRDSYGEKLITNSLRLMDDYSLELTPKQKLALSKVGLAKGDLAEFAVEDNPEIESEAELDADEKAAVATESTVGSDSAESSRSPRA